MKHPEIDERAVAELYVAGKLSTADVERFEEHYLDCPACIQAVEDAERLQRGLSQAAAEDLVARQTVLATAWQALWSRTGVALMTALLVLGLLPAGFVWQRAERLGADLDAARRALADERRPRINTPILALVPTRAGEQPLQQISLATEPGVDRFGHRARRDGKAPVRGDPHRRRGHGGVWESSDLEPSYRGTLTVSLHSSLLPPGEYLLSLNAEDQQLTFPLRIVAL